MYLYAPEYSLFKENAPFGPVFFWGILFRSDGIEFRSAFYEEAQGHKE